MSLFQIPRAFAILTLILLAPATLWAQTSIEKEATWKPADRETVIAGFEKWLIESDVQKQPAKLVRDYLSATEANSQNLIDHVIRVWKLETPMWLDLCNCWQPPNLALKFKPALCWKTNPVTVLFATT